MQCSFDGKAHVCKPISCVIGRPFLVEGRERIAAVAARSDWQQPNIHLLVSGLSAATRQRLATAWTKVALMEHASIAAFARFTMQLVSLGAPPELIEQSTAALADETKHAKLCFAIASAYGGREIGPGPLPIERSLDASSLKDVVLTTIREGCVGETIAALEAAEAKEHATEPAVREALTTIAEDETRHAHLAWRFVRWALGCGDADLTRAVEADFEAEAGASSRETVRSLVETERSLLAGGIVPDTMRAHIRSQAVARAVLPCARAVLAEAASAKVRSDAAA
jgi:hypothetical protein